MSDLSLPVMADAPLTALFDELESLSPSTARFFDQSLGLPSWSSLDATSETSSDGKPSALTSETKKNAKANARRSRHREREKRELMYLRACSEMLEKEVNRLRSRKEDLRTIEPQVSTTIGAWRALTLIRRRERKEVEEENTRLRALWHSQLKFVAQMQQFGQVERDIGPVGGNDERIRITDADVEVFGVLMDDLDIVYKQSGRMLADSGVGALPETRFYRTKAFCSGQSSTPGSIEMQDVAVIPASYPNLHKSIMDTVVSQFFASGAVQFRVEKGGDYVTFTFKSRYQVPNPSKDCDDMLIVDILLAMRKYSVTPSRHVAVWKGLVCGGGDIMASDSGVCLTHRALTNSNHSVAKRLRRIEPITPTPSKITNSGESQTPCNGLLLSEATLAVTEALIDDALSEFECR